MTQCNARFMKKSAPPMVFMCALEDGHDGQHVRGLHHWEDGGPLVDGSTAKQHAADYIASTKKTSILTEAQATIHGPREDDYGSPTTSFENIARLWATYLQGRLQIATVYSEDGFDLNGTDVAHMMILLKISRAMTGGYKRDNLVDGAGYFACIERMMEDG